MSLLPWRSNPDLNDELQTLMEKMEQLRSKADDIQCRVQNEELHPRKKRKSEVALWLKRVQQIEDDVESNKAEVVAVENKGPRSCRAMLNEMKGRVQQVDQLLKQGKFSEGLVLDDLKPKGIELVTTKLEGFTPLMVKDKVWSAFTRGESRVGIFGMGGVGKTTVAMHVNNEIFLGWDCFKHVFYVTVLRGSTVLKLQEDISKALTLTLNNEDETRRAAELHMWLKKREKSLLILDDIWEDIPMEKVGVAVEGDGCKLLITTRKRDVCRKMSCDTIVEMKPLLENEAWDLFANKLGNYESLSDVAKCAARSIAKECAGLPLGIITMASCMRGECDEREWRHMLRQLQNPYSNQDDMDNKVFNILKNSYERLSTDRLRWCLLFCALYLEDYEMLRDTLINRLIAVALLRDEGTRKENIDEGHHMLKALADASLLEFMIDDYGYERVKMHDLIRDMAVKIMGRKGIVKARKGVKEIPRKEEWKKDLVLVSLMGNCIEVIGDEICPECPNLLVLMLCCNPLQNVQHSFFVHMTSLRCLDLSETIIDKLPNSIANLCNLDALLLNNCPWLNIIPSLARLTKLKDLNLSSTGIKELPEGVEELINLEYLNITMTMIQSVPEELLNKLSKLESFLSNYKINILPKKFMSLRKLLRFEGKIDDFDAFRQFVSSNCFNQLERYSFLVRGPTMSYISTSKSCDRHIIICDYQLSIGGKVGFKVPHNVQGLKFEGCSFGVECLLDALPSLYGATELEEFFLEECKGIKYIVPDARFKRAGYEGLRSTPFKGVCRLDLVQLEDFVGLYEGKVLHTHIFFDGLREFRIDGCPSVNKIWLQNDILPNLESIEVSNCKNMEEVFATTEGEIRLPCLKSIFLCSLSQVRSICKNNIFLPCLEKVFVKRCSNLVKLWSEKDQLPRLQHVSSVSCFQMNEIFPRTDKKTTEWPKVCSVTLQRLPELKSIGGNEVFFPQLQNLHVSECPKLKNLGLLDHKMPSLSAVSICDDAIQLPNLGIIFFGSVSRKAIGYKSLKRR